MQGKGFEHMINGKITVDRRRFNPVVLNVDITQSLLYEGIIA